MSEKFLHRDEAPFGGGVWTAIDETVVGTAKSMLAGRRLLEVKGPFGLDLKSISSSEFAMGDGSDDVQLKGVCSTPVVQIEVPFKLSMRDIAAYEEDGVPFNRKPLIEAAKKCAAREDELLFHGSDNAKLQGLMNLEGAASIKLNAWDEVGTAAQDIISAVNQLDSTGYQGPYRLALSSQLYNLLFRRYPDGDHTELEHIQQIVSDGVYKAPVLKQGGVLLASNHDFAYVILGCDLAAAFVGPEGRDYEFTLFETIALQVADVKAYTVLSPASKKK